MKKLDAEESAILAAFDAGTLKSVANAKAEIKRHREAAVATFAKDSGDFLRLRGGGKRWCSPTS